MQCVVRVEKGEEKANANTGAAPARKKVIRKQQQQRQGKEQQRRKPKSAAAAAAVDEDLYKISPNVICKVQKASILPLYKFNLFRD